MFPETQMGLVVLINAGGFARGWGDAVTIDLFQAITGTEAEWSPWDRFAQQVRKVKDERAVELSRVMDT